MKLVRVLALVLGCPLIAQSPVRDSQTINEIALIKVMFEYEYAKFGCPLDFVTQDECVLPKYVDYGLFMKARGLAKKVFGLTEQVQ